MTRRRRPRDAARESAAARPPGGRRRPAAAAPVDAHRPAASCARAGGARVDPAGPRERGGFPLPVRPFVRVRALARHSTPFGPQPTMRSCALLLAVLVTQCDVF